jgi:HK97 family phage portal protein
LDTFKGWGRKVRDFTYAKFLNGYVPSFGQFGDNIYASDVVQTAIDVIATEISKLLPKHIRTDNEGKQSTPKSSINRLFKFAPNDLMTTRDFLEKVIWTLFMNYNAFIYPVYDTVKGGDGESKVYRGFYPLNPVQVDFLQDEANVLFVKFHFATGDHFTVKYSEVIHLRKKFSVNEVMGGGANGQPDNEALLKILQINDTVIQGIEKGIKTSLSVRGIVKLATMLDDKAQKAERDRFEKLLESGKSGIMPMDLKGDFIPVKLDPKMIDKDTMEFLDSKVQRWFGVSLPILSGDYTDEQYQAFYEKTLEPLVISLGQAFSKCLFSARELDVGNEIVFYHRNMMYLSTTAKLNLIKTAGEQGLLSDDQKLAILGYPPIEDGSGARRTMSLNYIDVALANAYQMGRKSKATGDEKDDG